MISKRLSQSTLQGSIRRLLRSSQDLLKSLTRTIPNLERASTTSCCLKNLESNKRKLRDSRRWKTLWLNNRRIRNLNCMKVSRRSVASEDPCSLEGRSKDSPLQEH
jgi:rRNA-processing protein FCF1